MEVHCNCRDNKRNQWKSRVPNKNQRFDGGEYFDVNKWYTTVLTIEDTSRLQGFINGTLVTNATETTSLNGFTTMTRLFVNENDPFLAEIDYIVMVPNALTEAQMTSLYSTYSQGADIETFLSDNSLTPTVKYTFENDNTNTGTATGLPAISFQATDTYSAESIEKYQVWMYMLSPDGVGGAGDHNVLRTYSCTTLMTSAGFRWQTLKTEIV